MRIAITGGAGFIGSHLARAYLDEGHDVIVIDNLLHGERQAIDERARFYQIDIRDSKLQTILQQERPDIVSHHAAQQHDSIPGEQALADADVHIRGLLNVLDSCVAAGVGRIIFASSGNDLYGPVLPQHLPVMEDTPLNPQHPYDISKVAGEWYVRYYTRLHGLNHTILRYADVYGETDHRHAHHPISYFIQMMREKRAPIMRGGGNEARDHIFIDDVVQANLLVLTLAENSTLHISSGRSYSFNQLYKLVAERLQSDLEAVYISGTLVEEGMILLNNSRAWALLGWRPHYDVHEGIGLAIQRWGEPGYTAGFHGWSAAIPGVAGKTGKSNRTDTRRDSYPATLNH